MLAKSIAANPKLKVNMKAVQTNIIIFEPLTLSVEEAQTKCKEKGLLLSVGTATALRAVTHLDVSFEEMEKTIEILNGVFS